MLMEQRECRGCKGTKPLNLVHFQTRKGRFLTICRKCNNETINDWKQRKRTSVTVSLFAMYCGIAPSRVLRVQHCGRKFVSRRCKYE